jgi:hypothetical protein
VRTEAAEMRTVRPIVVYTWTEIYNKLKTDNTVEKFTPYLKRRTMRKDWVKASVQGNAAKRRF